MKTTDIMKRLAGLGGEKWKVHFKAREMIKGGADVIELTIGEPDVPTPDTLVDAAVASLQEGRTGYSDGQGEIGLRDALAGYYTRTRGRAFAADQIMCFPGTQTALYAALQGVAEAGDEVLVGDPLYATYEGVIRASGATPIFVPLHPEHGFRLQAEDLAKCITPRTRALLLNSPHNPTGAVLTQAEIAAIGDLALAHDFWIISDEVYEDLVFDDVPFVSPLSLPQIADRVVAVSSISKSHAAPGFRSGWAVGPLAFMEALLPLAETMLFGNQPFIADMTAVGIREGSLVAAGMRERFQARAAKLADVLHGQTALRVHMPEAGMFALIDVSATGMGAEEYAFDLLERAGVAVMPGTSFGAQLKNWVRVALTVDDADFATTCDRIAAHSATLNAPVAQ